jgi:hypothetical protein
VGGGIPTACCIPSNVAWQAQILTNGLKKLQEKKITEKKSKLETREHKKEGGLLLGLGLGLEFRVRGLASEANRSPQEASISKDDHHDLARRAMGNDGRPVEPRLGTVKGRRIAETGATTPVCRPYGRKAKQI